MKRCSLFPLFIFLLFSCGDADTRFQINGKFKNINQAEFFLINLEEGTKDTLRALDGRFSFETNIRDTTTYILLFPNFSELPIIAEPGHDIDIEGDASHLKETTVEGSKSNELLTAFRLKTNDMMPPEVISEAEEYIRQHAASPIATYLLRRYFMTNVEADYAKAYELCSLIREAQPSRVSVAQLHNRLASLKEMRTDGKLPAFEATDTNGKTVSNAMQKADINVVCLWASWNFESQSMLRHLGLLQKAHPGRLNIISISVDATPEEGRQYLRRDSLTNSNVCDGLQWESPVIKQLGLAYIPDNIVTDSAGNILARSLSSVRLREKIEQLLN
jgi:hypothetical protein